MGSNTTGPSTTLAELSTSDDGWHDWGNEFTARFAMAMGLFIIPGICMIGIVGNIFNIIVFKKHGLSKSSTILLFSLALSDLLLLLGYNNFIKMYFVFGPAEGMPYFLDHFFFILLNIFDILDAACTSVSFNLPVLLVVDRVVAIFLPTNYNSMITPKRITIAIAAVYLFGFGGTLYFKYSNPEIHFENATIVSDALKGRTDFVVMKLSDVPTPMLIFQQVTSNVPVATVIMGCAAAFYKLRSSSEEDDSDSEKETGACRTSRTLLTVCVVYIMATMCQFMPGMLMIILSGNIPDPNNRKLMNMGVVIGLCVRLIIVFKATCNFFIYFFVDPKIKSSQMQIINSCRGREDESK